MKKQIFGFMMSSAIGLVNPAFGMIEGSSSNDDSSGEHISSSIPKKTYNIPKDKEPKIWKKLIREWAGKLEIEKNKSVNLEVQALVTQACLKFLETKKPFDPNAVIAHIPQEERQFVVQRLQEIEKEWKKIRETNDDFVMNNTEENEEDEEDDTIDFYLEGYEKEFGEPLKINDCIQPTQSKTPLKQLKITLKTVKCEYNLEHLKNMKSLSTINANEHTLSRYKGFDFFNLVEMLKGTHIKSYQSNVTWNLNKNKKIILDIIDKINLFAIDVFVITGEFPDLKFGWKSMDREEHAPSYENIKKILERLPVKNLTLNLPHKETKGPYYICKNLPSSVKELTLSNLTLEELDELRKSTTVGTKIKDIKSLALPCEDIIEDKERKKLYAIYLLQLLMNCNSLQKLSFEKNKNFGNYIGSLEGLLRISWLEELNLQEMDLTLENLEKLITKLNPPKKEGKKKRTKSTGGLQNNKELTYQPFDLDHENDEQKIKNNVNKKIITIHLKNNVAFLNNSEAINEKILELEKALSPYYQKVIID